MAGPKRFLCTACGKCCYGQLPLTLKDALAFAGLFPLGLVWTPVQKGSKDFKMAARLGMSLALPGGREMATLIVPTSFIPASFPCPALVEGKLCGIHDDKPSRCKAMPFYPYREERFQDEVLKPRQGWECDVSESAPVVYDGKRMVDRGDFDREQGDLLDQVPAMRRYAEYMLRYSAGLAERLWAASLRDKGGHVVTSLTSLLTALRHPGAKGIARQQWPLLQDYATRTAGDPRLREFHAHYLAWSTEMAYLSQAADGDPSAPDRPEPALPGERR